MSKKIFAMILAMVLIAALPMGVSAKDEASDPQFLMGNSSTTQFTNANGIYMDGAFANCRDSSGNLWSIVNFTNETRKLKIYKGTCIDDLSYQYDVAFNFNTGAPGTAFDNISYPDGPKSRGQVWPYGLYIAPDGTFYCYFHNETGWSSGGQGYTLSEQYDGEPDFRHVGLMTSTNQGRNWDFKGWVLTANENAYTTTYQPDGGGYSNPQTGPTYCLGAADFSIFVDSSYIYIFYTKLYCDINVNISPDQQKVYVARASLSNPGTFYKYYNGNWDQPGNRGNETQISTGYLPTVVWSTYLNQYLMVTMNRGTWMGGLCGGQIATSSDLIHWSTPRMFITNDATMNKPYWTICNAGTTGSPNIVGQQFRLLYNQWGDDVRKVDVTTYTNDTYVNQISASAGFSNTQGMNGWTYQHRSFAGVIEDLSWDPVNSWWRDPNNTDACDLVGDDWIHPGQDHETMRVFTCPSSGTVDITGAVQVADIQSAGVIAKIVQAGNEETLWSQTIPGGATFTPTGVSNIVVTAGTKFYFCVDRAGSNNYYCTTSWNPVISYHNPPDSTPGGFTQAPRYSASALSSFDISGHGPANVIDGDNSTFWTSDQKSATGAEWIAMDMGQNCNISRIRLYPRTYNEITNCFPVDFKLQYSTDGSTWNDVPGQSYTGYSTPGNNEQSFTFNTAVTARYIRLYATRFSADIYGDYYLQIAEMSADY